MSKAFKYFFAAANALPLICLTADEGVQDQELNPIELAPIEMTAAATSQIIAAEPKAEVALVIPQSESLPTPVVTNQPKPAKLIEKPVPAFTGKVKGRKVRMRANADLESRVIKELEKNTLITVLGEKGDFWAVEPPKETKAYVFRSFVLDNVVEGNRVNIRLEPDLEAPVIGHLNSGDKVQGTIAAANNKWLEITPPQEVHFYVAKEFIENVGGPEIKKQFEKRKESVEELFENANHLSKTEFNKSFDEIDIDRITQTYQTIVNEFSDFPDYVEQAKESLALLQENYVQKKIAFLESRGPLAKFEESTSDSLAIREEMQKELDPTDKMKLWEPVEESLYLTWARLNEDKNMQEFYDEQKIAATPLTGILDVYNSPVKNKPGDFILRDKDLPVAYLYSTQINLQNFVGKKVTIIGSPRPNNHFAFPAYFVLSVE